MKLSVAKWSVATVLGLGVAVTGVSWYTGKQAEPQYPQWVQVANHKLTVLRAYGIEAEIKNVQWDRHLFSTDVRYEIETHVAGIKDNFVGQGKLYHGPFPLNRLGQGKLLPAMASLESQLTAPETLKAYFHTPEVLTGTLSVSYGQNISGEVNVTALKGSMLPFEWDAWSSQFALDKSGKGEFSLKIPNLISRNIERNQKVQYEQLESSVGLVSETQYPYLSFGNVKLKAKSYSITDVESAKSSTGAKVTFNDIAVTGHNQLKGEVLSGTSTMTSSLEIASDKGSQSLGKFKIGWDIGVNANALNALVGEFSKYLPVVGAEWKNGNYAEALEALVSKPMKLHLTHFSLENTKGIGEIALILNSDGAGRDTLNNLKQIPSLLKQSKFDVNVNIAFLEELLTQINILTPRANQNAEAVAKQTVDELVNQAKNSSLAQVDEQSIRLKLEVDNGKVKLNDQPVPEAEVQSALFMLIFALSSMGH